MATITFSGLTSGLDTSSWVDALVSVRQTTITSLQTQKEIQQSLLSVVNNIKSFFTSFQTCLQKITDTQFGIASLDLFAQNLAASSNTNILTATATTEAARQTYDVLVEQLATSTKATSGYTKTETKNATLDTTLGQLGATNGTITVNSQAFTISEKDTLKDLIEKFSNVGVVASFNSKTSKFTVGVSVGEIDDGTTGLKSALGLTNKEVSGKVSGSIVYANSNTKLSDLGLTGGAIKIHGINVTITKSGNKYSISIPVDHAMYNNISSIGDFLNVLKNKLGAEQATIDDKGNITIRGAVIESVSGGSNLKDVLNLGEVTDRTVMTSGSLTWQKTNVADLNTTFSDLGITGLTASVDGTTVSCGSTIGSLQTALAAKGVDLSIDENGVITVDTNGKTLTGTIVDKLGLVADGDGTKLTSGAHTVTYKADGNTTLATLGITNTDTYTAYKSDGTAITGSINNVASLTVDGFIAQLKTKGLDASFDEETQKITINDGYITGNVATKFGMTSTTETHQETATLDTTLEKLGATGNMSLSINGGTATTFTKTATLSTVVNMITANGGTVDFKDGVMSVSDVTLSGTLASLLGFSATTQGTSVTSGALSVVTNSSATSSTGVNETVTNDVTLDTTIGEILGLSSGTKDLGIQGSTNSLNTYNVTTTTLRDLKTDIENAGGTFMLNDDNTITVENVVLSGTLVTGLGLAGSGACTTLRGSAVTVGGVETPVTADTTLAEISGNASGTWTAALGSYSATFGASQTLGVVQQFIATGGGTMTIDETGVINIEGVELSGTIVDLLQLTPTQSSTSVSGSMLEVATSIQSTSSAELKPVSVSVATSGTALKDITTSAEQVVYVSDVSEFVSGKTYHVSTVADVTKLAELTNSGMATSGVRFVLDNDIDMSSVSNFAGIGTDEHKFMGTFDGQNHTIKNLTMGSSSAYRVGFFGSMSGVTIQNLGITGATITGKNAVGILAGDVFSSTVSNCYSTGTVTANGANYIGGLIGNMNTSTLTGSYSTANVSGTSQSKGGLVGQVGYNGKISNCYATGTVSGSSYDGSFVGVTSNAIVSNCYSTGAGNFVSKKYSGTQSSTYTNCVCTGTAMTSAAGADTFVNCAKLTAEGLKNRTTMESYGFTADKGWVYKSGENPILISTGSSLGVFIANATKPVDDSYVTQYSNGVWISFDDSSTLSDLKCQLSKYGCEMTINSDGSVEVSGGTIYGTVANRLGLTATTQKSTTMSSNSAITLNQSYYIEDSTTIGSDLGVSTSQRSYAVYDDYGNVIATTSTDGTSGSATIGDWLSSINTAMNAHYGTSGVEYAKIENGAITIDSGYIKGDLVTALGITTSSSVSGKLITGTTAKYKEDSAFIGEVSNQVIPTSITRVKDVTSFTSGQTYYLSDYQDLQKLSELVNAGKSTSNVTFVMTNDIDMSSVSNFAGIGTTSRSFMGTFLGNGYEIKNLSMSNSTYLTALFNHAVGATIKDLGLSNVDITNSFDNETSNRSVGALVGYTTSSTIDNCYVTSGNITALENTNSRHTYVGGLVGNGNNDTITNCYASVNIDVTVGTTGTTQALGGFLGNGGGESVTGCYSTSNINYTSNIYDINYTNIGGFAGQLKANGNVQNCYATGNIDATSYHGLYGAGFLGYTENAQVSTCYAVGNVRIQTASDSEKYNGFVSRIGSNATLTNCIYSTESGIANNGEGNVGAVTGVSGQTLAQILSGSNGLPQLTGKNPYIYREIQTNTKLSDIGLSTALDRTISVTIDGQNYTKSFGATATVQTVLNYLNGLTGITATFEESQLRIAANTTQNLVVGGTLATTLFGDSMTESNVYETHNNADKVYYTKNNVALSEATRVGDLLGTNEGGTLSIVNSDGSQISLSYSADTTLGEVLLDLANNGVTASISAAGVFSAKSASQITLSGDIGRALLGSDGTTAYADSNYQSEPLYVMTQLALTGGVTLDSLGVQSGNIQVLDSSGNLITTVDIDNTKTLSQLNSVLSAYGFSLTVNSTDKTVIVSGDNGGNYLADGTSNLISQLKLNDGWNASTVEMQESTTMAQLGFTDGTTLSVVLDGTTTMNLSFGANNTMADVIASLSAYGIDATAEYGTFTASSMQHTFRLSGELASKLLGGATYDDTPVNFESAPLTYNEATTKLSASTTVRDLLGADTDGTLRLTLDGTVINMSYNADDTVQDIIDDLANLGIDASVDSSNGKFYAVSYEKTFVLSGDIGRALQGSSPVYTESNNKYESGDLSYDVTSKIDNSSLLKDIGVTSGSVFVLDRDGNVINTIDIDENMTITQAKAALKSYGIDMSLDTTTGKVTVSSNDGYSLADGTSNMISQFNLPAFTQTTAKLTTSTTLAQMGFKDGADLNILLDGSTPTSITFGATDTVQDIINSLQALGINASVNTSNGAFTATSTEHSFVFSGDLGKFLTSGTAGYVNSDKGYITEDPLMVDVPVVTNTSKELTYSHALNATDTVESMGFEDGGVVRLILDGTTPYSCSFLATDTMQDIMDTLATYGIQTTIDANGKISLASDDHSITLGGELGSYLINGGTYTNTSTHYTSASKTFETTEKIDTDTKLSDLGVASGALNIIKDAAVAASIQIDDDTTVGQLFSAIKPYGMKGSIFTNGGNTSIYIYSEGDTYLADGTCDAVTQLGLTIYKQGDYNSHIEYWSANATTGLITEDMLLTELGNLGTVAGSLIFDLGTGDDKTQHIVNISDTDTVKSLLDKMSAEGVHAVLDNGVIKLDNSVEGITFTGGSSPLLGILLTKNVDTYATSNNALTYQEEVVSSVANFADANTTLSTVNVTDGKMSIFVDGIKTEVAVNSTDKFSDLFSRISSAVAARTGVTVKAGFVGTVGEIVTNPAASNNTGIIGIEVVGDHTLVIGASNDTTNFATIANLKQETDSRVAGSRALYKVNGNSLIMDSGLFKDGNVTAGTFKIGDATFTIDNTTTLNSLINQINKSDKSYASAYWDTLSGTLVVQSTLSGESLINIESGTSNFTDIMGFTEVVSGKETLITDRQTLGQNAIVKINGTTVTSTSNTITSDISKIKGLTINLKGVSAGETVTITVEQDKEGIYNAVNDIVDAYNTLMEGLEKELGDGGSLEHDTMFTMMKNQLKRLMTQTVGGTTVYKNLAAVGISTGAAQDSISTDVTALIIDKDKFMQALEKDSDAVKQLLVGTTANNGVLLKVGKIVDSTLKTTGYIASTENSINKKIKKMDNKISDLTTALSKYREQLEAKFSSMERVISNMQSSYSSFLNVN